ncbi:Gamma-glutamyltransferase [Arthroderma uncinatum]|uniref:Gamma-glutamyltransferase n=1 Tax=Arthroderma uncinatum TaxID=74035 RepID=UPI00144A8DC4|nr:Gamma-glutamyltransferase [Arthroderma uncinatum]KAF3483780.1 Gamma-glutamyltransferase [Arthroderma uncinatum]
MAPAAMTLLCTGLYLLSSFAQVSEAAPWLFSRSVPPSAKHDGRLGAVASENGMCSQYGADMLKLGGNAADAMVATVFCVGVTSMYHSGIGGGGFMLIRAPNGTHEFIDFRETAPAAAFQDMFKNSSDSSTRGGLASGVPGEVRGLEYLHKNYGKLPWSVVMQPAIRTARDGFRVTKDLARIMATATRNGDFLSDNPTWAVDFAPQGTLLQVGDLITRRRYGDTLDKIARYGADAFYTGPMAKAMINALSAANGTMTLADLKNYTVARRPTAEIEYRGMKVTSTTAPSSGVVLLSILKLVNGYKNFFSRGSLPLSTHRLDEAIRFGYGQRTELGDPLFVTNLTEYQRKMISEEVADKNRRNISDAYTQSIAVYDPKGLESLNTPGTSHISTADNTGMAVSLTTTINLYFGSRVIVPETGIIMNNEMDDFSIPGRRNAFGYIPSPSNFIRPGKRPLSSICPTIITDKEGNLYFISGAAGGSQIITGTLQSIVNVMDRKMNVRQALAAPRLHDQLVPNEVLMEASFDQETVNFMKSRKHNVTIEKSGSTVESIMRLKNGTFVASGEPRLANSGGIAV